MKIPERGCARSVSRSHVHTAAAGLRHSRAPANSDDSLVKETVGIAKLGFALVKEQVSLVKATASMVMEKISLVNEKVSLVWETTLLVKEKVWSTKAGILPAG